MFVLPLCRRFTAALLLVCAVPAFADYVVDTDVDADNSGDGHCSLREAIQAVNNKSNYHECISATPGDANISFAISPNAGESHVIALTSALPPITRSLTLDATTQGGTSCAPAPNLRVQITNPSQLPIDGLTIVQDNSLVEPTSTIKGLGFAGFTTEQKAGLAILRSDVEVGCTISGTDLSGASAQPNFYGIYVNAPSTSVGIATSGEFLPNLISGNTMVNVYVDAGGTDTTVSGNYIGVDASGAKPLPSAFGVYSYQVAGLRIGYAGGDAPAQYQRNVIGVAAAPGATAVDVEFDTAASDGVLAGNYIGVAADGTTALPLASGLAVSIYQSSDVLIGCDGIVAADLCRNVIANPSGVAVVNYEESKKAAIVGNYIGVGADGAHVFDANNAAVAIELMGAETLIARNLLSTGGAGTGIVLSPNSLNYTPIFVNGASAGSGGAVLDSAENCVQGNGAGVAVADASNPTELSTTFANNWWGAADGPAPGGNGDSVADNVAYSPFLTAPSAYCGGNSGAKTSDTIFIGTFN